MFKETEVGITEMSKQQKSKHKDMYNNVSPKPKAKINKWDYIKIKHFCKAKKFISKMKMQPTENHWIKRENTCKFWRKYLQNIYLISD